jgi:hypothetical protein
VLVVSCHKLDSAKDAAPLSVAWFAILLRHLWILPTP